MELIQEAKQYILFIGVVIVFLLGIVAAIGVYFIRFYRVKGKENEVDYNRFERQDAAEFVKFDEITNNMIVMGNRFLAGIRCTGIDYPYAEEEEKLQIMRGYLAFFNVIDHNRIQFRQTAKNMDLGELIDSYQTQLKKLTEEQYIRTLDYEEIKKESLSKQQNNDEYALYLDKLKQMQREITSFGYQMKQLEAQIAYIQELSGENAEPERMACYYFDWTFHALEYTKELKKEEIYEKAGRQLWNMANSYISALKHAGVKAYRMSGAELEEEIRLFTHPLSGANLPAFKDSNYDTVATTSASIEQMEQKVHKDTLQEIIEALHQE